MDFYDNNVWGDNEQTTITENEIKPSSKSLKTKSSDVFENLFSENLASNIIQTSNKTYSTHNILDHKTKSSENIKIQGDQHPWGDDHFHIQESNSDKIYKTDLETTQDFHKDIHQPKFEVKTEESGFQEFKANHHIETEESGFQEFKANHPIERETYIETNIQNDAFDGWGNSNFTDYNSGFKETTTEVEDNQEIGLEAQKRNRSNQSNSNSISEINVKNLDNLDQISLNDALKEYSNKSPPTSKSSKNEEEEKDGWMPENEDLENVLNTKNRSLEKEEDNTIENINKEENKKFTEEVMEIINEIPDLSYML